MTKRLIEIDDALLDDARKILGVKTMKDTVNVALRQLIDTELRRRHLTRLESGEGLDLTDEKVMREAWR